MKLKLLFLTPILLFPFFSNAQSIKEINTTDLIFECSKYGGQLPSKQMAIWYPNDFWAIIESQMKFPSGTMSRISNEMKNYLIFAVVDYTMLPTGKITFKSEDEIRKTMVLIDSENKKYFPLREEELSSGAKRLQEDLKPVMEKMFGQVGEGLQMIIFTAPNVNGKNMLDLSKKGSFTLNWNATSLKWKLPFYSVLPPKFCPVNHEEMKGNWDFCPEHGKKLN